MAKNHINTLKIEILSPRVGRRGVCMEKKIQELKNKANPERWRAAINLGNYGEQAIDHLHEALSDEDKWVRYFAVDTLGDIGHRKSVDPLIQMLLDADQDVRWVTAAALGKIGDPRAAHALRQAYTSDNAFVKIFIEEALDKLAAEDMRPKTVAHSQG